MKKWWQYTLLVLATINLTVLIFMGNTQERNVLTMVICTVFIIIYLLGLRKYRNKENKCEIEFSFRMGNDK